MFLRLLLLLLFALNAGVGGWLLFGQRPQPLPPATDPGVPELQLLSANPAPARVARQSGGSKASGQCLRIGPFVTRSGMQTAFDALSPHVPEIQFSQQQVSQNTGWWVYLPAVASQEQALQTARKLADEGIQDYYVITAGDHQNTVSLGLFNSEANARRRYERIVKLGLKPELKQRTETLPEYWIDIALPSDPTFAWRAWVSLPTVDATASSCSDSTP
ncbi:MAG TPA: SPOR domain-containing protein [Rhodanobacteraceae bacterium]